MSPPSPPPPPPGGAAVAGAPWWDGVVEYTKAAQASGCDPAAWAAQVSAALAAHGVALPSPELAQLLAAYLDHCCLGSHDDGGGCNASLAWRYVERALAADLASPMLLIALLSVSVIPNRCSKPVAYRLYLELVQRYSFSFASQIKGPDFKRMMALINNVLNFSEKFGFQASEPWVLVVEYVFSIVWQLLNATLDDEGLQKLMPETEAKWGIRSQYMEMDGRDTSNRETTDCNEKLRKVNTLMTIEIIWHFLHYRVTSRLLSLVRENMPTQWRTFTHGLRLLVTNSSALRHSTIPVEKFQQLAGGDWKNFGIECKPSHCQELCVFVDSGSLTSFAGHHTGGSSSSLWLPVDLYLEDCIYGSTSAPNAIEILPGLVKALRVVNGSTWCDAFLALWMASLRLVQRERSPVVGPIPRQDTRLCLLLSITTLCIANIIEEEEATLFNDGQLNSRSKDNPIDGERRKDLASSLQLLGDYESLLEPPPYAISAANKAAAKAMMFVSERKVGSGYLENFSFNDKSINCTGSMWHLVVEACISRSILDASAYFWPGYINGRSSQITNSTPNQPYSWSALVRGAPLTSSMVSALVATPASSLAELEKVYEIATSGSDDDKVSAATILCGSSLIRGWNIQEHAVCLVIKLLSPPYPISHHENKDHWISRGPLLHVILTAISSSDCVLLFSFHGLVPELAGALMAICEVFGSCLPSVSWTNNTGEKISTHSVFSVAFILLSRMWNFNYLPCECCGQGDTAPVESQLTPEYLLLLRNSHSLSSGNMNSINSRRQLSTTLSPSSVHPVFLDSFPKFKIWYKHHQACLSSTLSGISHSTPAHQNVDILLSMMFKKITRRNNQSVGSVTSGSSSLSNSSGSGTEDTSVRPELPSWDIMEAVPFVVDAALTACSHGKLSPRDFATGLKDLADFLPASLTAVVSYFSAEVARGVWKPAFMNGTDWPSPAANLLLIEEQIKKIVAASGVNVPSLIAGESSQAFLPLPLAALVTLTITYRLDNVSERFMNLVGPALSSLAASCPWPSMPIVAALWTQKVKRWSEFFVFSASRTVFHHNSDAVVQLLRSCFSAALGLSTNPIFSNGGVGSLLGHCSQFSGGLAPGLLYLRVYKCIKDNVLLTEKILSQLLASVEEIAEKVILEETLDKLKRTKYGMKYRKVSFAAAMTQVKVAAALGATFVWLLGGPGLAKLLFQEMLPSWFASVHKLNQGGRGRPVHVLSGYALAYFAVLSGMFMWDIGLMPISKRRPGVITRHMEFIASVLERKIWLGCDWALWQAYVSGFLSLVVECAPSWVLEVEMPVLKRLSRGLRQWNEHELALALLRKGGFEAMAAAAEVILSTE